MNVYLLQPTLSLSFLSKKSVFKPTKIHSYNIKKYSGEQNKIFKTLTPLRPTTFPSLFFAKMISFASCFILCLFRSLNFCTKYFSARNASLVARADFVACLSILLIVIESLRACANNLLYQRPLYISCKTFFMTSFLFHSLKMLRGRILSFVISHSVV